MTQAEQLLVGQAPCDALFTEAARIAAASCHPDDDVRGPATYRRAVVGVYTRRALQRSAAQALVDA